MKISKSQKSLFKKSNSHTVKTKGKKQLLRKVQKLAKGPIKRRHSLKKKYKKKRLNKPKRKLHQKESQLNKKYK